MKRIQTFAENPLGFEKIGKLILRFSIPAIASNLLTAVYNIVDQIYIGQGIGPKGLAATNIAFPMVTIVAAVAIMLGVGCAASFNLNLGAGNREKAERLAGTGLSVMAISGLVLTAIFLIFLTPLLNLFGATKDIIEITTDYAFIVVLGVPFQVLTVGICQLIRADGSPTWAMICMTSGAVFNIIFDPVFMFGFGWGIKGIAWATTLGQVLSAVLAISYIIKGMKTIRFSIRSFIPRFSNIATIFSLGLSPFANQSAITLVTIVMNNTLSHYGDLSQFVSSTDALAAVGAISKINIIFISCSIGIGQGCQPINSFNFGAKQYPRVRETLKKALFLNLAVGVLFFTAFQLFPKTIISIFGDGSDEYIKFATRYLQIFMFMTFANGLQGVTGHYFTAIGRPIISVFVSMTRQIIFLIPLLLLLPIYYGIDGVVFAGPIADSVAATLSTIFILRELRKLRNIPA